jgi:hypothetical protein
VPARIERRISLVTCSESDRLSMGRTDPELADVIVMSAPRSLDVVGATISKISILDCYHISGLSCDPQHAGVRRR